MSDNAKVAIVTGGERNIGRSIVETLLRKGMRVCIAGIDRDTAEQAVKEIDAGSRLIFLETDVRDEDSVRSMCSRVVDKFGRIDAMVANAALSTPDRIPLEEMTLERWKLVIDTNVTGCFLCAKSCWAELRRNNGSMVLIASTRAFQSEPDSTAYSTSKGAVVAMTHALAMSGGPDIRVNCISPGWINVQFDREIEEKYHKLHPAGRVGELQDVANMAAYLLSDEASFITGQNFIVDGGMSRKMIYA